MVVIHIYANEIVKNYESETKRKITLVYAQAKKATAPAITNANGLFVAAALACIGVDVAAIEDTAVAVAEADLVDGAPGVIVKVDDFRYVDVAMV